MRARILLLSDAAKAMVRWWSGALRRHAALRGETSGGPEQQRANVMAVDEAAVQRWTLFGTRSSDSTSTLYHIVAWRMALAGGAWERQDDSRPAQLRNSILDAP